MQAADDCAVPSAYDAGPAQTEDEIHVLLPREVGRPVTRSRNDIDGWKAGPVAPEHGVREGVPFACEEVREEALSKGYDAGGGRSSVGLDPEPLRVP